jgi:hypothetical protein
VYTRLSVVHDDPSVAASVDTRHRQHGARLRTLRP